MTEQPGTALERRQQIKAVSILSDDEIRREWRLAEALASSGMFPDAKKAGEAFAKMLIGHDLGLSPTQALMGVYIVKGKPQIAANLLASFVKRTPGYDYEVTTLEVTPPEKDDDPVEGECTIAFFVDGKPVGLSTFTMEDARAGGNVKDDSAWKKYPRNMLFARAMSNGVRWYMPDATGGVAVYTEGELETGDVPQLTAGSGSGEAEGLDLGPKVEKVLARAAELGHEVIADRATAEMALGGRGPEVAVQWCKDREAELNEFEASKAEHEDNVEDAVIVEAPERAAALREAADSLDREAEAEGVDEQKAAEQRAAATKLREQADALEAEVPEGGDGDGE